MRSDQRDSSSQQSYEDQVHFMNRQSQMLAEEGNDVSSRVMQQALAMLAIEHHRAEEAEAALRKLKAQYTRSASGALDEWAVEYDPDNNFCFKRGTRWVLLEDALKLGVQSGAGAADAKLIAAAPELLDVVRRLGVYLPTEMQPDIDDLIERATE